MSGDNGFELVRPDNRLIANTEWAWNYRIERYGLNNTIGPEKVGKGFFNVRTLARLTTGSLPGCYRHKPIAVAIVAYEDRAAEWVKRMDAAGADKDMWFLLKRKDGAILEFNRHLGPMFDSFDSGGISFVYFDQMTDHLGMRDSNSTHEVRRALAPLAATLNEREIGALANTHPNKKKNASFRDRVAGSAALYAVARTTMFIAEHPNDPGVRVAIQAPNNHGPTPPTIEFKIVDTPRDYRPNGRYIRTGLVRIITEDSSITLEDLDSQPALNAMQRLDRDLTAFLDEEGGSAMYPDIKDRFSELSYNRLRRAADRCGILIGPHSPDNPSIWSLPRARLQKRAGAERKSKV